MILQPVLTVLETRDRQLVFYWREPSRIGMGRERDLLDETLDAYVAWREECVGVHDQYRWAQSAPGPESRLAYVAYRAALEREERAANVYKRLLERLKSKPLRLDATGIDA